MRGKLNSAKTKWEGYFSHSIHNAGRSSFCHQRMVNYPNTGGVLHLCIRSRCKSFPRDEIDSSTQPESPRRVSNEIHFVPEGPERIYRESG